MLLVEMTESGGKRQICVCVCVQVCLHVSLCTCVVGWERLDLGVGLDEVSLMALHPSEHPSVKQSGRRTSVSQCERKYPTQTHTHTRACTHIVPRVEVKTEMEVV